MDKKPAKHTDWNTRPMPVESKAIPFSRSFAADQFNLISAGLIPVEMEDRWFIYFEAPWLYLHRSWTGYCIYKVRFQPLGDEMSAVEAVVNREPTQYSETDDAKDADFLRRLLERLIQGTA